MGPFISSKARLVKYYSHLARYIDDWSIFLQPNHLIGWFHHLVSHLAKNSAGVAMQLMSLNYNDGMVQAARFFMLVVISRGLSKSYTCIYLGGGFKCFLFSPLLGNFLIRQIFFKWVETTNQIYI